MQRILGCHLSFGLIEMLREHDQVFNSLDFCLILPYSMNISDIPLLCILWQLHSASYSKFCSLSAVVLSLQSEWGNRRTHRRNGNFGSRVPWFSSSLPIIWIPKGFCLIQAHILTEDKQGSAGLNTWICFCYGPTEQLVTYSQTCCFSKNLEPASVSVEGSWHYSHPWLTVLPRT